MNSEGKIKLCYLLPEIKSGDHTHFEYLSGFLSALEGDFEIFLIKEKTGSVIADFLLFRFFRIFTGLLRARLSGFRNIYVHYSFFGALIASVVVYISGGRVFYWNCGEPWKYKRNIFREIFERAVYHAVNFLVTGSESLAAEYSRYYGISPEKIVVMSNWIDLKKATLLNQEVHPENIRKILGISADAKIILFVHRLSKRKGAQYLPEILKRIGNENVVLVVAGDGPEKNAVVSRIADYGLQSRARFLGWIPQREILSYFNAADIFIMPSDEEGFPHVMLESMAAGLPFVASGVGSVKDMVPPEMAEYVVAPGNTEIFSEKIIKILRKKPSEIRDMESMLKSWVTRYDISESVRRFTEMMR